jgi:hypothetical protein
MTAGDSTKATTSWHWLAATVAAAAVASVFVPKYGWRDALRHRSAELSPRIKAASAKLEERKALDESDAEAPSAKASEYRARLAKSREKFASYGFDDLPSGEDAVFEAQGRVSEALAKRSIRIVSTGAKIVTAPPVQPPPKRVGKERKPSAKPAKATVERGYSTSDVAYSASGDFRDMFMFLVDETRKRPNYSFKDISVVRPEDGGTTLDFVLQVNRR